jgi:hypothetical protein
MNLRNNHPDGMHDVMEVVITNWTILRDVLVKKHLLVTIWNKNTITMYNIYVDSYSFIGREGTICLLFNISHFTY